MGSNPFQIPEFFSLWANIPHLSYLEFSKIWTDNLAEPFNLTPARNTKFGLQQNITSASHDHGLPENNLLTTLHLQGNQEFGVNLSSTFFNNLPRLSTLVLDDCGFTQFPNISDVIDTLTRIFIRTSDIETIDLTALTGSEISETATPMSPLTEFRMPNAKLTGVSQWNIQNISKVKNIGTFKPEGQVHWSCTRFLIGPKHFRTPLSEWHSRVYQNCGLHKSFQKDVETEDVTDVFNEPWRFSVPGRIHIKEFSRPEKSGFTKQLNEYYSRSITSCRADTQLDH